MGSAPSATLGSKRHTGSRGKIQGHLLSSASVNAVNNSSLIVFLPVRKMKSSRGGGMMLSAVRADS